MTEIERRQGSESQECQDINGDGQMDVLMDFAQRDRTWAMRWYPGPFVRGSVDLAGSSSVRVLLPAHRSGFHTLGDFNGDGSVDLALAWFGADRTDGEISVWFGPLSGDLDPHVPDLRIESTAGAGWFSNALVVNLGDIDGDGTDDLAFSSIEDRGGFRGSHAVYVFKGPLRAGPPLQDDDADTIISWKAQGGGTGRLVLPLGDVDGDRRDDFAVAASARRHRPPRGFPLRVLWPPELATPEDADSADTNGYQEHQICHGETGDSGDTGITCYTPFPIGFPEGAIMVFGNVPPGEIGPERALFTLAGTHPGDMIGRSGIVGPGDLDGDGLGDLAYAADITEPGPRVRVVFPCADFGEVAGP